MFHLLYGSGLRLMECVRLRVQDLDFDYLTITVRDGKGEKDRAPISSAVVATIAARCPNVVGLKDRTDDLDARFALQWHSAAAYRHCVTRCRRVPAGAFPALPTFA